MLLNLIKSLLDLFSVLQIFILHNDVQFPNEKLVCFLQEFFKRIGIEKLRFKATYNPYTEPSMEVFR